MRTSVTVIVLSNDVGELYTIQDKKTKKNLFRTVHYLFSKMCDLSRTEKETAVAAAARSQEQLFRQTV